MFNYSDDYDINETFEQDETISQLLAEIDATLRRVQKDHNTIQEKVSEAYLTLKTAKRREQRKKTAIIISILAILLLVAIFIWNW